MSNTIRQPNCVTMAKYDYTIGQQRIMLRVIQYLQTDIQVYNTTKVFQQLTMFDSQHDVIIVNIPFNQLCLDATSYEEVVLSLEVIRSLPVRIITDRTIILTGLFERVEIGKKSRTKIVAITISKAIAIHLLDITKGFTRFNVEIAFNLTNKYTSRIYQLICKWRDKEVYQMKIEEFRDWLFLTNKYLRYDNLNEKVIKLACLELRETADVYFAYSVTKKENIITHINFIPKIRDTLDKEQAQYNKTLIQIKTFTKPFEFTTEDEQHFYSLISVTNYKSIFSKLIDLEELFYQSINKDGQSSIEDKGKYCLQAIMNLLRQ